MRALVRWERDMHKLHIIIAADRQHRDLDVYAAARVASMLDDDQVVRICTVDAGLRHLVGAPITARELFAQLCMRAGELALETELVPA